MKAIRKVLGALLVVCLWPGCLQASDLSTLFQANEASVVTIRAGSKIGTGFYVAPHFIVTNLHVVRGSRSITYYSNYADGGTAAPSVVAVDAANDLVILLAAKPGKPVRLGDYDSVSPGAELFAIGSPQGYEKTITNGMLSQKRKDGRMQISIAVSPGSSGSPVFTMQGEVVGVVVAQRADSQNLNFAIPSDRVQRLLQKAGETAQADYVTVADSELSRDAAPSGGVSGSVDVDFAGVDTSLPGCRNYASRIYENSAGSLIKLCTCNDAIMLTNRLCQCQPCRR
ncbi:MAG: S1C family serine protease [Solidesulfovibrio sp. DCME]|uniref:S1C family serine protease n=1 Tax=Solidesulfovibrio sp. DCME TaxID=3447380 RepID=UPI003D120040